MARYIDADKLFEQVNSLEQLARKRVYDTPTNSPAYERYATQYQEREKMLAILKAQPTADVVPKSEVERLESEIERLKHILDCYALQYGTVKEQQDVIDKANQEFASEIFEEIENIFTKKIAFYEEMKKRSLLFHVITYAETMITNLTIYLQDVTELKKKYTEGEKCPDCKHFVGCEKAVWTGHCEEYDKKHTEGKK